MLKRKRIVIIAAFLAVSSLYAATVFSGYAGGKLNYSGETKADQQYDPDLKLQAFFAGQFNFSQNTWAHMEFSVETNDLMTSNIFDYSPVEKNAAFQIDELSYIIRGNLSNSANYFSLFMGTYDPIGSDVFLKRYFSIEPIASKLTDSYMGLSGSVLYPQFGFGFADILRMHTLPMAFGGYVYLNQKDNTGDDYFVLNTDLRYACAYRYFTCDFAVGAGVPLANQFNGQDVFIAIDKVYLHGGTTMLFGNNYTKSIFMQAGLYNIAISANRQHISDKDLYLLFEPRYVSQSFHINLSLYSFPAETTDKLLFVDDTLGGDLNMYSTGLMLGNLNLTIGGHLSFSIPDKNIFNFDKPEELLADGYNIDFTPYITAPFISGELHLQAKVKLMYFSENRAADAFSFDLGYRSTF